MQVSTFVFVPGRRACRDRYQDDLNAFVKVVCARGRRELLADVAHGVDFVQAAEAFDQLTNQSITQSISQSHLASFRFHDIACVLFLPWFCFV